MDGTRRRLLTRVALTVMMTAAVLPVTAGIAHADGPVAEFDWEMPARTGLDANHDGVIDARTTQSAIGRPSAGWQVAFDACASKPSTDASIETYTWGIGVNPVGEERDCRFTYDFPEEGVYEVTLVIQNSDGRKAYVTQDVTVQDFLVVALGDSFGSGQGNPDIPIEDNLFGEAEQKLSTLEARLRDLTNMENAYETTRAKVNTASHSYDDLVAALKHEADVCNVFGPNFNFDECVGPAATAVADRTGELLSALRDLGLASYIDTLDLIDVKLQQALDVAQAAVDAAGEAVDVARRLYRDAKAALSPVWQNKRCNRSSIAGQAQAALDLERADAHTSVTLVHLACSGATIGKGLIGPYAGVEPPSGASDLPPQVEKAATLIGDREVDAVLVSVGGNDVGFGDIVKSCIYQEPCFDPNPALPTEVRLRMEWFCAHGVSVLDQDCRDHFVNPDLPDSAAQILAGEVPALAIGTPGLPGAYDDLAGELEAAFPAIAAEPQRVYITEYPNATEDDDGSLCVSGIDPFDMLPGISEGEGSWLRNTVTGQLNDLVEEAALRNEWTFVGGIYDRFAGHGYCADNGWFRRLQDSFRMQGTMEGSVHPTAAGHEVYADEDLKELQSDLYLPDGGGMPNLDAPRPPNPNYSSSGGGGGTTPPPAMARFEWTMDPDGTAHFDGCESTGHMGMPIIRYTWPVPWVLRNGQWFSMNESGEPWVSSSCDDFTYRFTEAGRYRVVLDVLDGTGHGAYVDHYPQVSDASPPSVGGTPDGALYPGGWYSGNVTIDWQATDPAPSSGAPTDPPNTVASTGGSVVYTSDQSCDPAGNCATGALRISIDKASPSVVGFPDRKPNAAGWYSGNVTIDWHATDPAPSSGVPTDPANTTASTEGTYIEYSSGESCDPVHHCATGAVKLSIDKTAPTAKADASPGPNANGWNNTDVTVSFSGNDDLSGIASCDPDVLLASEGAGQSASGTCKDKAGNTSAPATASGINIDKTAPALACPSPTPTFLLGETGATVSAEVSDGLSGPAAATVSAAATTTSVGAKDASLTGVDRAGNESTVSCPYVVAYVFNGFFSPVDGNGVLNVVKAGRAIPLKWRLTDASGAPVTSLTAATVTVRGLDCSLVTTTDLVEETFAGGSGLQNLGDGYYQLNWKTPSSYAGSCKTMRLDLGEGLMHAALFKFKS